MLHKYWFCHRIPNLINPHPSYKLTKNNLCAGTCLISVVIYNKNEFSEMYICVKNYDIQTIC